MKRYILFDLDGTLLPLNTDSFLEAYIAKISAHFSQVLDPQLFAKHLMGSSYATIANTQPGVSNKDKYFADFFPKVSKDPAELMPMFDDFYLNHFPSLGYLCTASTTSRELVETALNKGYGIVLATNPIFPQEAVWERMRWANVYDLPWDLVTSYENTCACKPHPAYFSEILSSLGTSASQCIHIGNDLTEDMAAAKVGIPVVMATDYLINRHNQSLESCLFHGTLEEVLTWAKEKL